jgi:hypothetical protein
MQPGDQSKPSELVADAARNETVQRRHPTYKARLARRQQVMKTLGPRPVPAEPASA